MCVYSFLLPCNYSFTDFFCVAPSMVEPFPVTPTISIFVEKLCELSPLDKWKVYKLLLLALNLSPDPTMRKQRILKVKAAEGVVKEVAVDELTAENELDIEDNMPPKKNEFFLYYVELLGRFIILMICLRFMYIYI